MSATIRLSALCFWAIVGAVCWALLGVLVWSVA